MNETAVGASTTNTATTNTRTVKLFLSWCRKDRVAKERLVDLLTDQLKLLTGVHVEWWEDSHLRCGEEFGAEIVQRIGEADYGLLLLSPAYFASSFIQTNELPRFVGANADRKALPVALKRLAAFDGSRDFRGVELRQVYFLRDKSFDELSRRRDEFAQGLATEIRRWVLDLGGWRSLCTVAEPVACAEPVEVSQILDCGQVQRLLVDLQPHLAPIKLRRLQALAGELGSDNRVLMARALDVAGFAGDDEKRQNAFLKFRKEVAQETSEAGLDLAVILEARKSALESRYCWFERTPTIDADLAELSGSAARLRAGEQLVSATATRVIPDRPVRIYVSFLEQDAKQVQPLLKMLGDCLSLQAGRRYELADSVPPMGEDREAWQAKRCSDADLRLVLVSPSYFVRGGGERDRALADPDRVIATALTRLPDGNVDLHGLNHHYVLNRATPWQECSNEQQWAVYVECVVDEISLMADRLFRHGGIRNYVRTPHR